MSEIVNFHIKPVNRRTNFNDLHSWDKFWKQASFQLGIVQKLGGDNDNYEGLFGDVGTPYIGAGFRVLKWVRLGGGVILYELKDPSPVISDKVTKGSLSFSISINAGLSEALGLIGRLFKPKT